MQTNYDLNKSMYRSTETYSCQACGKSYKNSASLTSHKYRYHDNSSKALTKHVAKEFEFDKQSSISNSTSMSDHDLGYISVNNQMNKFDIETLKSNVRELRSLMNKIDTKVILQGIILDGVERIVRNQRTKPDTGDTTILNNPEEVSLIIDQTNDNRNRIRVIEEQLMNSKNIQQVEGVDNEDNVVMLDMVDDMVEIGEMFRNNNFKSLKSDVPKLRHSVKLMLDSLDVQKLDQEDVQLLEDLYTSSKRDALTLLQSNFSRLVGIFKILKPEFEGLFEDNGNFESTRLNEDEQTEPESEDISDDDRGKDTDSLEDNDSESNTTTENKEAISGGETVDSHSSVYSYNSVQEQISEMSGTEKQSDSQVEETDGQSDIEPGYQSVVISGAPRRNIGL